MYYRISYLYIYIYSYTPVCVPYDVGPPLKGYLHQSTQLVEYNVMFLLSGDLGNYVQGSVRGLRLGPVPV